MKLRSAALPVILACSGSPSVLRAAAGLDADDSSSEIISRYVAASQAQEGKLKGVTMTVDIRAELPRLKKQGRFHALKIIPRVGKITYDALFYEGDKTIRTEVIARWLTLENQAQLGNPSALAITPQNYKFKLKGKDELDGRGAYVFQLSPKKKRVGLFKGELWLDIDTTLPLREIGKFVKSPSVFLKKVEFVRDFDIQDGVAVPRRVLSQIDTRIAGPAEIAIDFSNLKPEDQTSTSLMPSGSVP